MKESRLKDLLLNDLKHNGVYARKMLATGNAGFPDVIAHGNRKFLPIEAKTMHGAGSMEKLVKGWTPIQIHEARLLIISGADFMLVGSDDNRNVFALMWTGFTDVLPDNDKRLNGAVPNSFKTYADFLENLILPYFGI